MLLPDAICRLLFPFSLRRITFPVLFLLVTASASAQELVLLQKIPQDLYRFTGGARPDANGLSSYNQKGFKSPEFQRGAMQYMIRAILRNDDRCVEEGWKAIDATFQHQEANGSFSRPGAPHGGPSALAFWLADLNQAILVLQESPFAAKYKTRIDALTPKIRAAVLWLAQPQYLDRLKREDLETPNRLLFDALAFGLSGILLDDNRLKEIGRSFVDLAIGQFRSCDGVFLEKGGPDSSYQAVAALKLQVWAVYFPDPQLDAMITLAVCWEIGRVGPDGQIDVTGNTRTGLGQEQWMGHNKDVNPSEITHCLLYYYARTGDEASLAAAKRIVERRKNPQQVETSGKTR
jgi:hypothetical protein